MTIEPNNQDLMKRSTEIDRLRTNNQPTIPTFLGIEKKTNPFLRPDSIEIQKTIKMNGESPVRVFAKVRELKDHF